MLASLVDQVSGSPWTYAVIFAIAALDAVFPVVPSETILIAGGVVAAGGELVLALVIAVAAAGALLGDNCSYAIGRLAGERIAERLFRGGRRRRLEWAQRMLEQRGGHLIVVARFIPGGRTATTLVAGFVRFRWRRFLAFDLAAALIWASYGGLLGYFGGRAFQDEPLKGLLVAFAIALTVTVGIEVYRWQRKRRARPIE